MGVAIKKAEINAAITAASIPAADAAGIWPAARAARDGAPRGTPEAARRNLAIAAAIAEVSARTPALVPAFTTALTAPPAPAPPVATPPAPSTPPAPTPTPTPVPPEYADAVDRALRAAGIADDSRRAVLGGEFADAILTGRGLKEATNRLFEGLDPGAEARGRARFAGLHESRWRQVKEALRGLASREGLFQIVLLVVSGLMVARTPMPARILLLIPLVAILVANLCSSRRRILIAVSVAFIAFLVAANAGMFDTQVTNINFGNGVGDSTPLAELPE